MAFEPVPEGWWQSFVAAIPARTAKLALVRADGSPHVAPVWVDLERRRRLTATVHVAASVCGKVVITL
jgi:hypothetical protein